MQVINITSLSGTAPYDVYVCDVTITYCYLVASGVSTVPQVIDLPPFLSGVESIIVKVIDSTGCNEFHLVPCSQPSPSNTLTPSVTPTPTVTPTRPIYPCQCIVFDNTGSGENIEYNYINCNGITIVGTVSSGNTLSVCGSQPVSLDIKMSYTISGECVNNLCPSDECAAPIQMSLVKSVNRIFRACTNGYDPVQFTCTTTASQDNIGSVDFNGQNGCNRYAIWAGSSAPSGRDYNFKVPGDGITNWTQLYIGMRLYPANQVGGSPCGNIPDLNYWVSRNSLSNRYIPTEGPPIIIRVNNSTITNITDCSPSPSVPLLLGGSYGSGSVIANYQLQSDEPLDYDLTVFFKNILFKLDGSEIDISTDVTIFKGQISGRTEVELDDDFDVLSRNSSFQSVSYSQKTQPYSFSATSFFATPTNSVTPSYTPTNTPTRTLTPTPTISITPSISLTPSITPTRTVTPTITKTPRATPTNTPTKTPTPSVTSVPRTAYLFIEPISGATAIGNWMYTVNGLNFFGFSNATQPTQNQTDFNIQLNTYVDYSGWTSGQFPTIITQDVPQTSGGVDSFGNSITAYNFKTTFVPSTTTGSRGWYTWIIPVGATNNLTQTQIDYSLSNPNVMTTLTMESTIYSYTFTYTGNTIPKTTYKVYTTYPNGDFAFDANTAVYFKGNTVA